VALGKVQEKIKKYTDRKRGKVDNYKVSVRATRAEHSRRFLSLNYAIEYVTTYLQEIP